MYVHTTVLSGRFLFYDLLHTENSFYRNLNLIYCYHVYLRMISTRKSVKQKYKSTKLKTSASLAQEETVENITSETSESTIMDIGKEILKVLKWSDVIKNICGNVFDQNMEKLLKKVKNQMDKLFQIVVNSKDTKVENIIILAQTYLNIALVYIRMKNIQEFYVTIMCHLTNCLQLLADSLLDSRAILIVMKALNKVAQVAEQKDLTIFEQSLNEAMKIYIVYTNIYSSDDRNYIAPVNLLSTLGLETPKDTIYSLDKEYIKTLEFLLLIYGRYRKKDQYKIMIFTYEILNKQLNYMERLTDKQRIMWIRRAASLSEFFIMYNRFIEAKNHLSTAEYVMEKYFVRKLVETKCTDLGCKNTNCENSFCINYTYNKQNSYCQIIADISKYWALYGLEFMRFSYELFQNKKHDKFCEANNLKSESSMTSDKKSIKLLTFNVEESLETYSPPFINKYNILNNYADAKKYFNSILFLLDEAMKFYTPEHYLAEYVQIKRDMSRAHKYLTYYITDREQLVPIHSERLNILENILSMLKDCKTYYDTYRLKWIYFEKGITHATIASIMFESHQVSNIPMEIQNYINTCMHNCYANLWDFLNV